MSSRQRFSRLLSIIVLVHGCAHDPGIAGGRHRQAPPPVEQERSLPVSSSGGAGGLAAGQEEVSGSSGGGGHTTEEKLPERELTLVDAAPRQYVCGKVWRGPTEVRPWGWSSSSLDQAFRVLRVTEEKQRTVVTIEIDGTSEPFGMLSWDGPGRLVLLFTALSNWNQMVQAAKTTRPAGLVTAIRPGENRLEESEGHAPPWASIEFDVDYERCSNIEVEFSPPGVSRKRLTIVFEENGPP